MGLFAFLIIFWQNELSCKQSSTSDPVAARVEHYRSFIGSTLKLSETYYYDGRLQEAMTLLDAASRMAEEESEALSEQRLQLLLQRGKLLAFGTILEDREYEKALDVLGEAERLARVYARPSMESDAQRYKGIVLLTRHRNRDTDDLAAAMVLLDTSFRLHEQAQDCRGMAETAYYQSLVLLEQGKTALALDRLKQADSWAAQNGFTLVQLYTQYQLGLLKRAQGNVDEALAGLDRSLTLRRKLGFRVALPFTHLAIGQTYFQQQQWDRSLDHYEQAYRLALSLGIKRVTMPCLVFIGDIYRQKDDQKAARHYYDQAMMLATEIGFAQGEGLAKQRLQQLGAE